MPPMKSGTYWLMSKVPEAVISVRWLLMSVLKGVDMRISATSFVKATPRTRAAVQASSLMMVWAKPRRLPRTVDMMKIETTIISNAMSNPFFLNKTEVGFIIGGGIIQDEKDAEAAEQMEMYSIDVNIQLYTVHS